MSKREVAEAFSGHRFEVAFAHLADDVVWRMPGSEGLRGRDAVVAACRSTSEALVGTGIEVERFVVIDGGDNIAIDTLTTYRDGSDVSTVASLRVRVLRQAADPDHVVQRRGGAPCLTGMCPHRRGTSCPRRLRAGVSSRYSPLTCARAGRPTCGFRRAGSRSTGSQSASALRRCSDRAGVRRHAHRDVDERRMQGADGGNGPDDRGGFRADRCPRLGTSDPDRAAPGTRPCQPVRHHLNSASVRGDRVHDVLASAAFASITVAAFLAGGVLRDQGSSAAATWSTITAIVMAAGSIGVLSSRFVPALERSFGLWERLIYLGFIAWFCVIVAVGLG